MGITMASGPGNSQLGNGVGTGTETAAAGADDNPHSFSDIGELIYWAERLLGWQSAFP